MRTRARRFHRAGPSTLKAILSRTLARSVRTHFEAAEGLIGIGHGGYKGFGLSVMVNILTGVLNGGAYFEGLSEFAPYNVSERVSFVLTAVNIEQFVPFDDFVEQMENFAQIMKSCKLSLGTTEVYLPGEQGFRRLEERHRSGLPPGPDDCKRVARSYRKTKNSGRFGALGGIRPCKRLAENVTVPVFENRRRQGPAAAESRFAER